MRQSPDLSRICACALLDAWGRNDTGRMKEIASEVSTMSPFYAADYAESERLELLAGVAREMWRSSLRDGTHDLDPYLRLLSHLSNPAWNESGCSHRN